MIYDNNKTPPKPMNKPIIGGNAKQTKPIITKNNITLGCI